MALIFSTKKLLDRVGKWGIDRGDHTLPYDGNNFLNTWHGTYLIIEKQHLVV